MVLDFIVEILPHIGSFASVVSIVGIGYLLKASKEHQDSINTLKKNDKSILKSEIKRLHRMHMKNGYITRQDLEIILDLYERYRAVNGNSFVSSLVKEIKALPKKEG